MKYIIKVLPLVILVILVLSTFWSWFTQGLLVGGDFQIYYKEMFPNFSFFPPPAWNWTLGAGLGVNGSSLLWNYIVVQLPIVFFGNLLGFDWAQVQRIGYLYPYLILSIVLPYYYARKLFPFPYAILGLLIFSLNTYILMLVGGGQIFLSLAYILIPPVFYYFYKLLTENNKNVRERVKTIYLCVLFFSLQALFDIRIAYVTLVLVFLFACVNLVFNKKFKNILLLPLVLLISGLLHAFWVLPTVLVGINPLSDFGAEYTNYGMVKFLSFANFSNSISLLHPNWPENIFGKIYFMRPEFLILPVLAFSSLLFLRNEKKEKKELFLFFALAAIVGAFLAKGANEPFGGIYDFLFNYVPGFMMFRDPTKWYSLVALSYSVLIPFNAWKIYEWLKSKNKFSIFSFQFSIKSRIFNFQNLFVVLIFFYLLFLIRPALSGQLTGIFKTTKIPQNYVTLEKFLTQDSRFYRTLWLPRSSKYSSYSTTHPLVQASELFNESNAYKLERNLNNDKTQKLINEMSVRYVVIPYDIDGEIFLKDRRYDEKSYLRTIEDASSVTWLKRVEGFGKIAVFEVANPKDHFWSPSENIKITYEFINPTKYEIDIQNAKKGEAIVFSESFDKYWIAKNSEFKIQSSEFDKRFNSFILPRNGSYELTIYYTPQDWANRGLVVSIASFVGIIGLLVGLRLKKW